MYMSLRLNVDGGGWPRPLAGLPFDFRLELEDARALDAPFPAEAVENRFDVAQAYLVAGMAAEAWRLRIGRFRTALGSGRLMGEEPVLRVGRAADGVWLTLADMFWYDRPFAWSQRLEAVSAWQVRNSPAQPNFERWEYFHAGIDFSSRRRWPLETAATLLFSEALAEEAGEPGSGASRLLSAAARAGGRELRRGFDFDFEVVVQGGKKGGEPQFGWGFWGGLGHTFATPWRPRVALVLYHGSGDSDPSDGRCERLLLPAGGLSLDEAGLLGRTGWPNTGSFQIHIQAQPHPKVRAATAVRQFYLAAARDGWFDALGQEVARDPLGAAGSEIGVEVDAWADVLVREGFRVRAGYGWFRPGRMPEALGLSQTSEALFVEMRMFF